MALSDEDSSHEAPMFRLLRRLAIGLGLMLLGAGVALFFLYQAATAPVPEYQALLEQTRAQYESGELDQNRQELESQIAAVYSDAAAELENRWQTTLSAEQINGWLATQLVEDYPELAEQGLRDPRVLLKTDVMTFALRAEIHGVDAVVSLDLQPYVTQEGLLAIELASARVGSAPLPAEQILSQLEKSMGEQGNPPGGATDGLFDGPFDGPFDGGDFFRWTRNDGHPVLLVDLQSTLGTTGYLRSLETIEVREGEIYIAGETTQRTPHVAGLPQANPADNIQQPSSPEPPLEQAEPESTESAN